MASRFILALALIMVGGCQSSVKPISERGRQVCREKAALLPPESSIEARQNAYRDCLGKINLALEDQDAQVRRRTAAEAQEKQRQVKAEQASWASQQERLAHCIVNRDAVIQAERLRIRALGPKLVAEQENGQLSQAEREQRLARYAETERELELLIPARIRAGLPLIPDAIKTFSECKPESFSKANLEPES